VKINAQVAHGGRRIFRRIRLRRSVSIRYNNGFPGLQVRSHDKIGWLTPKIAGEQKKNLSIRVGPVPELEGAPGIQPPPTPNDWLGQFAIRPRLLNKEPLASARWADISL
jgi:hypothetical protein